MSDMLYKTGMGVRIACNAIEYNHIPDSDYNICSRMIQIQESKYRSNMNTTQQKQ